MIKATKTSIIECNIEKVWALVTNLKEYTWRSDITNITILDENTFIETAKENIDTTFHITVLKPEERYEFTIDNKNMRGHWIGIFRKENEKTTVTVIEEIEGKHFYMKPFISGYLKKQQERYINDLKNACR